MGSSRNLSGQALAYSLVSAETSAVLVDGLLGSERRKLAEPKQFCCALWRAITGDVAHLGLQECLEQEDPRMTSRFDVQQREVYLEQALA